VALSLACTSIWLLIVIVVLAWAIGPGPASAQPAGLGLAASQSIVTVPGTVTLTFASSAPSETRVDFYSGVLLPTSSGPGVGCPAGDAFLFLPAPTAIQCLSNTVFNASPLSTNVSLSTAPPALTLPIGPGLPLGEYLFFFVATLPGSLADGTLDPGDLVAASTASVTVRGLPPLAYDPPARLRGAHLEQVGTSSWDIPTSDVWNHIADFPRWGGNVLSLDLTTADDGFNPSPYLPGRPLTERLAASLARYTTVIDWALQHNVNIIVRFHPTIWSNHSLDWPDDGRSLWRHASAQDELVQAWADLARRFKGRKGMIFDPVTEPHNTVPEEYVLATQTWNTLYPRLINAIRAEDPERWIIIEPIWGDLELLAGYPGFEVSKAARLIYSFHFYRPNGFTFQGQGGYPPALSVTYPGVSPGLPWEQQAYWDKSLIAQRIQAAVDFRNTHNVRVMFGEFGTSRDAPEDSRGRWTADVIDILERHGFDWLYFTFEADRKFPWWTFETTSFESVVTSQFSLNLR
jgi:hypothetical protein